MLFGKGKYASVDFLRFWPGRKPSSWHHVLLPFMTLVFLLQFFFVSLLSDMTWMQTCTPKPDFGHKLPHPKGVWEHCTHAWEWEPHPQATYIYNYAFTNFFPSYIREAHLCLFQCQCYNHNRVLTTHISSEYRASNEFSSVEPRTLHLLTFSPYFPVSRTFLKLNSTLILNVQLLLARHEARNPEMLDRPYVRVPPCPAV